MTTRPVHGAKPYTASVETYEGALRHPGLFATKAPCCGRRRRKDDTCESGLCSLMFTRLHDISRHDSTVWHAWLQFNDLSILLHEITKKWMSCEPCITCIVYTSNEFINKEKDIAKITGNIILIVITNIYIFYRYIFNWMSWRCQ